MALGLAVGWLVAQIHRRLDDFETETVITLLTPYAAYIPAEHLGVSGVLATVAAGGYLGWRNPELLVGAHPLPRRAGSGACCWCCSTAWSSSSSACSWREISRLQIGISWGTVLWQAALVSLVTIVARLVYVPIGTYLPRLLCRRLRKRDPDAPLAERGRRSAGPACAASSRWPWPWRCR